MTRRRPVFTGGFRNGSRAASSHTGALASSDVAVDAVHVDIDDNEVIRDVKFKTFGCGAAVATSSMATEMIKGKSVDEALKITNAAVVEALEGLPPAKIHCSVLAEEAVKAAIEDYVKKRDEAK